MESSDNLLAPPARPHGEETIIPLIRNSAFTLEQIVSRGAASPAGFWYDQDRDEWVLLLRGEAELRFESDTHVRMRFPPRPGSGVGGRPLSALQFMLPQTPAWDAAS